MALILCSACGHVFDNPDIPKCPECGSGDRTVNVYDDVAIKLHEKYRIKGYLPGESKNKGLQFDLTAGDDLHRDTGVWNTIERRIDKQNNRYVETIKDSDGNTIRHVDEALTDHQGRGSARRKPIPDNSQGQ